MKKGLENGLDIEAAAGQAARDRFRAVMLTSLTTIAGLLPLLLETSTQAQFLIPLIVSLAFGLLAATILALIIVPAFYTILHDFGVSHAPADQPVAAEGQ
jgi:multidrug efflux pump subunit AcrB